MCGNDFLVREEEGSRWLPLMGRLSLRVPGGE